MSKAVKKSTLTESRDDVDGLSSVSGGMQIEGFVWVEDAFSERTVCEDLDNSETDAEFVNIAQRGTNTERTGIVEESLPEYDEDTDNPSEWEKEVLVDHQYWEQNRAVTLKDSSSRIKYPTQRLTIRQLNNIANSKAIVRHPSYFKFDISTTATLETLIAQKYVGPLHNVVSKGKNSVVLHADCPETGIVRIWSSGGNAVKVYKLTNDVKANISILKRVQREYEHLRLFGHSNHVPYVVHRMRNVLILEFFGDNQETAPSITQLPSEHFNKAYQVIVKCIDTWYTKYNIVHGNLCTKNVLFQDVSQSSYYDIQFFLCIIGWGHSVKREHPRALIKLMRDCYFITNFFRRRNVLVKSTEELFKHITGLHKISSKVLDVIHKKDLWQDGHLTNPNR